MWVRIFALGSLPEQCALGQDDGDPAALAASGSKHVLHPRPVGITLGRHTAETGGVPRTFRTADPYRIFT